jgi:hypothetical protein
MRRTYRYDAEADMVYEVGGNYFEERTESGPSIISDYLPGGINGIRNHADGRMHDSKSAYTKAVRRAGCEIVGNESPSVKPRELIGKREIGETVKRAIEEHASLGDRNAQAKAWHERSRNYGR